MIATLLSLGLMAGAGLFAITILGLALFSPLGTGISVLFAVLIFSLALVVFRRTPLWPGSWWWMWAALIWGAGSITAIAGVTGTAVSNIAVKLGWMKAEASWGGAYPEEIAKALGIFLILIAFKELNRPWHGFLVGTVMGLAFECFENIAYGAMGAIFDPASDLSGVLGIWGVRMVLGFGFHAITAAAIGYGIGLALYQPDWTRGKRLAAAAGGLLAAFLLHFAWNYQVEDTTIAMAIIIFLMVVLYAGFAALIWAIIASRRSSAPDTTVPNV